MSAKNKEKRTSHIVRRRTRSKTKKARSRKTRRSLGNSTAIGRAFTDLCQTVARLRDPKDGCPWDLKQTHQSLRRYMIEEAYEASHAMTFDDPRKICDELGDVLLQVVLNAQIANDHDQFSVADVIHSIDEKMRHRHPHVFAKTTVCETPEAVKRQWEEIKDRERGDQKDRPIFDIPTSEFPAFLVASKIGKISAKIRFDWQSPEEVFSQLQSEMNELENELRQSPSSAATRSELGDVVFTWVQLCRHLGYDPESIALDGNLKFLNRFQVVERLARDRGLDLLAASREELEELWRQSKVISLD